MQATTHRFDPDTRSGQMVADDGILYPFDAAAFATSRLRHLRVGQRLTVVLDPAGRRVVAMSLGSIGALDRAETSAGVEPTPGVEP